MESERKWHYASETAALLCQAMAHIQLSLHDGHDSIASVGDAFDGIAGQLQQIGELAAQLPQGPQRQGMERALQACAQQIRIAITGMQFYDTLTQRMETIGQGMQDLSRLIDDPVQRELESRWLALQQGIQQRCHIHSDILFLAAIREGKSFDEARQAAAAQKQADTDVELF